MDRPFFSIITVSFNADDGLRRAVEALMAQTCGDYEHIIKDGGSSDGSVDAIRALAAGDPRINVTVSPDKGIYDAMNQAVALARGEYIYFLNCGDAFADERVLEDVKRFVLEAKEGEDAVNRRDSVIYGDFMLRGEIIRQPAQLSKFYLYRRPLNHQSAFFGRGIFEKCGGFDTSLSIRADHELTLRAYCENCGFLKIYRVVAIYEGGGFSERPEKKALRDTELEIIRGRFFTDSERKRLRMLEKCGLPALRKCLRSKKSPRWVRKVYRKIANWFSGG